MDNGNMPGTALSPRPLFRNPRSQYRRVLSPSDSPNLFQQDHAFQRLPAKPLLSSSPQQQRQKIFRKVITAQASKPHHAVLNHAFSTMPPPPPRLPRKRQKTRTLVSSTTKTKPIHRRQRRQPFRVASWTPPTLRLDSKDVFRYAWFLECLQRAKHEVHQRLHQQDLQVASVFEDSIFGGAAVLGTEDSSLPCTSNGPGGLPQDMSTIFMETLPFYDKHWEHDIQRRILGRQVPHYYASAYDTFLENSCYLWNEFLQQPTKNKTVPTASQ